MTTNNTMRIALGALIVLLIIAVILLFVFLTRGDGGQSSAVQQDNSEYINGLDDNRYEELDKFFIYDPQFSYKTLLNAVNAQCAVDVSGLERVQAVYTLFQDDVMYNFSEITRNLALGIDAGPLSEQWDSIVAPRVEVLKATISVLPDCERNITNPFVDNMVQYVVDFLEDQQPLIY